MKFYRNTNVAGHSCVYESNRGKKQEGHESSIGEKHFDYSKISISIKLYKKFHRAVLQVHAFNCFFYENISKPTKGFSSVNKWTSAVRQSMILLDSSF